jgi:hypothetical protein
MAKRTTDLAFAAKLRNLFHLLEDADLEFVFDPDARARSADSGQYVADRIAASRERWP